ncbi:putative mediator of RNA polymerase II transcription subunit 12 [Episyrphus balteatus]|uniref:putative mediator of RNA polymerase II transcription subunit 12 n=1 Tax=Episyrphus balteatus TaxID=286459 RepID=UPI002485CB27|nr:putative mediator of RNA polymerase II transcription subunit 12 [Episyrphus balteatus]
MGSMKTALLICCLLIGIFSAHGIDKKADDKSKVTPDEDTKIKITETKDKRQIGSSDTASYANEKQDDPEQPQETIYGPKPNHFLIRPLSPHDQQLRNYQPTSRPHSQQLQALGPQLEQSQEIQHFAYLQDTSRNHQAKAVAEGKSHTLVKKPSSAQLQQYAAEEQYAQQQLQSQAQVRFTPAHGQFRPSEYIPQQQQQQEQQPQQAQYQSLQEEHLLKLIEEELQARALQEAQARASYSQPGPQIRPVERQGLVNYRSKPEESPDYSGYSQAPRAGPHQGQQYLPQQQQHIRAQPQQQAQGQQVNFYHGPSAVSYRTLPNHPLAESSLEKEIEKLLASNRPSGYRHSSPPALLSSRSPFLQPKSYSTTASPPTTVGQASQYYSPSVVQYNGFQPSPTAPTINHEHKKYVPSAFSTSQPQYVIESSPSPSKPSKSSSGSGQYRVKLHTSKSKNQGKQNLGPVQFYYGEPNQQQTQQQQQPSPIQQQQQEYQQYAVPTAAPSQSSIYVSQSTGVQPSQKTKVQSNSKHLELPPPDGKPITQAEFQALVDAGYPVQAVPVPVPVPYEQYIKEHPEYTQEQLEIPHRHTQRGASSGEGGGVTYLRPLPSERQQQQQQQQPRHPREQKEEATPGKNESS